MIRFGYVPSPKTARGTHDAPKLLAAAPLPTAWDDSQYVVEVLDQQNSGTCTCQAGTQGIRMTQVRQGVVAPPLASRLFLYFAARSHYGQQKSDDGTYIHAVYEAANALGFPPEDTWPFSDDPVIVNAQPDWGSVRAAADQKWGVDGFARIDSTGNQLIDDVKRAIASGHPVEVGSDVDQAFMDLAANKIWPGCKGTVLGGHAFLAVGYDTSSFIFVNSWGSNWCRGGYGRFSYAALQAMNDIWFPIVAPAYSEVA